MSKPINDSFRSKLLTQTYHCNKKILITKGGRRRGSTDYLYHSTVQKEERCHNDKEICRPCITSVPPLLFVHVASTAMMPVHTSVDIQI